MLDRFRDGTCCKKAVPKGWKARSGISSRFMRSVHHPFSSQNRRPPEPGRRLRATSIRCPDGSSRRGRRSAPGRRGRPSAQVRMPVTIRWEALGVRPNQAITLHLGNVPLDAALRAVFDGASIDDPAECGFIEGAAVVPPKDSVNPVVRVYDLRDLLALVPDVPPGSPPLTVISEFSPFRTSRSDAERDLEAYITSAASQLSDPAPLVRQIDGRLVMTGTQDQHHLIQHYLHQLRKASGIPAGEDLPEDSDVDPVLDRVIPKLDIPSMPLINAIESFRRQAGVDIVVGTHAWEFSGKNTRTDFHLTNASMYQVLRSLAEEVNPPFDFSARDGIIRIGAPGRRVLRCYNVSWLRRSEVSVEDVAWSVRKVLPDYWRDNSWGPGRRLVRWQNVLIVQGQTRENQREVEPPLVGLARFVSAWGREPVGQSNRFPAK